MTDWSRTAIQARGASHATSLRLIQTIPRLGVAIGGRATPEWDVPVNDEYALVRKCRQVPLCLKEEIPLTLAALLIHHTASDYIYAVVLAVVHG